jgi:ABC-2 type transport system ATP-binding protein
MSTLLLDNVSRWFGNVVAVNDVTMAIEPGVTGLLGPNGAGKSTLIHMMGGFLPPSSGSVTLDGEVVWRNEDIYRKIGIVPEREAMYDVLSGWEFVLANARLHKLPDPDAAARSALEAVHMTEAQDRAISTYSKGMKQRVKMATALVHDPPVLLLDEPFNGMDPRQRLLLMDLLTSMGEAGRTVLFSSHILEEVEQITGSIQVMVAGRHAASGGFREIRRLMTERPHEYTIRSDDDRALASAIIAEPSASGVQLIAAVDGPGGQGAAGRGDASVGRRDGSRALHVQATDFATFVHVLPQLASRHNIRLYEVSPADESLESVFAYLVAR